MVLAAFDEGFAGQQGRVQQARAEGRKIVGLLTPHVPAELIRAAGAEPFQLWPQFDGERGLSDSYLEYFFATPLRVWFDQALDGALSFLDLLVVPRTAEHFTKWYLYLREVQRQEPARPIPKLHLFDLLQSPGEAIRKHNRGEAARLYARIGGTEDGLRSAVETDRIVRQSVLALRDVRRAPVRLSGVDAARVYRGVSTMAPVAARAALARLEAAMMKEAPRTGPRLLLLGPSLPQPGLLEALEATGATVVAEEHAWGGRSFTPLHSESGDDLLDAIAQRVRLNVPSARSFTSDESWLRSEASEAQGAVFLIPSDDDSYGWEYPGKRDLCHALGLKTLLLRDFDRAAIAAFLESL